MSFLKISRSLINVKTYSNDQTEAFPMVTPWDIYTVKKGSQDVTDQTLPSRKKI
jgi:hypothetical protein